MVSVRRDYDAEWIYREDGKAIIDDPDLKQIMAFYRKAIGPGTLLNLGAGPLHAHYMAGLEDKLTHITALDISEKNLRASAEFLDSAGLEAKSAGRRRMFINEQDVQLLQIFAEASANRGKMGKHFRNGGQVLRSLREKCLNPEGRYDFIAGDMHDLDNLLGQRKFDNIMIGYALYANMPSEIPELFKQIKRHLNLGGRVIIADFQAFSVDSVEEEFDEDEIVRKKYPNAIDYSLKLLVTSLEKAGFHRDAIRAEKRDIKADGEEKKRGWKYLFVSAENR